VYDLFSTISPVTIPPLHYHYTKTMIKPPMDFLEAEELVMEKLKREKPRYYQDMCRNFKEDQALYTEKQAFVDEALKLKRDIEKLEKSIWKLHVENRHHLQQVQDFKFALKTFCGWSHK
jgi:hypothetical protein